MVITALGALPVSSAVQAAETPGCAAVTSARLFSNNQKRPLCLTQAGVFRAPTRADQLPLKLDEPMATPAAVWAALEALAAEAVALAAASAAAAFIHTMAERHWARVVFLR